MPKIRALVTILALVIGAAAPAGSYTLRWGDTLSRVAKKLGVSVDSLAATNGITDVHRVRQGQVLVVPGAAAPAMQPIAAVTRFHRVAAGENLTKIANRYRTTVAELERLNGLRNKNLVREGAKLTLPAGPAKPMLCPVKGATRFDFSNSWGAPRHGGRRHMGNDIFAKRGTAVVANTDGVIRHVTGTIAGLAYYIEGADGHVYYGAHLDSLTAKPGHIESGAVIGTVGTTGNARGTPPHLHFEVKPNGGPSVDPHALLRAWCSGSVRS